MKNLLIFVFGIFTGIMLIPFIAVISDSNEFNNPYNLSGLNMLKQKGECITSENLEIMQTLHPGIALAFPAGEALRFDKPIVLLINEGKLFYDGEKIKVPVKKCAKQIGTYTYQTKSEIQKTVPAVIIERKNNK